MTFGDIDGPMFCELFGLLIGLDTEWRAQGASEHEITLTAFDWDYVPYVDCGGICTAFNTTAPKIIEDNDEYRIERDFLGRTMKLCKAGMARQVHYVEFPGPVCKPLTLSFRFVAWLPFSFFPSRLLLFASI